jgi:hypothetical protein
MGAPAVQLSDIPATELQVVGFNGRAATGCGYSLPIIRHTPTGLFALVSRLEQPVRWDHEDTIREFERQGRLTLLPIPLPCEERHFQSGRPVLAWADKTFLETLGRDSQVAGMTGQAIRFDRQWHDYLNDGYTVWVWLGDEHAVVTKFELWANRLQRSFDDQLQSDAPPFDHLATLAHFGLCAASKVAQRYGLYTRLCAALYMNPEKPPERAQNVFRILIRTEFPTVTWDRFREDMMFLLHRSRDARAFRNGEPEAAPVKESAGQLLTAVAGND